MGGRRRASEVVLPPEEFEEEEEELLFPAPKAGAWIARPQKSRPLLTYGIYAVILLQIPGYVRLMFGSFFGDFMVPIALAYFGLIFMGLIGYAIREWFARRMTRTDGTLVDGAFGKQGLVELIVVADDRRLGSDRGVVWFDGGLMGFSGAATSFVLAAADLEPSKTNQLPLGTLLLRNAPVAAYIVLTPIGKTSKVFRRSLKEFLAARVRPEGERIWPPLEGYEAGAVVRGG